MNSLCKGSTDTVCMQVIRYTRRSRDATFPKYYFYKSKDIGKVLPTRVRKCYQLTRMWLRLRA